MQKSCPKESQENSKQHQHKASRTQHGSGVYFDDLHGQTAPLSHCCMPLKIAGTEQHQSAKNQAQAKRGGNGHLRCGIQTLMNVNQLESCTRVSRLRVSATMLMRRAPSSSTERSEQGSRRSANHLLCFKSGPNQLTQARVATNDSLYSCVYVHSDY
jgi:hypothetical protein